MMYYLFMHLSGINDWVPVLKTYAERVFSHALRYNYFCEVRVRTHNANWKVKTKVKSYDWMERLNQIKFKDKDHI